MKGLRFDKTILADFARASTLEWLVPNGLGGYASSTACGANCRKYHGLLVASFNPPVDRRVLLAKLEEELSSDSEEYFFSANLYANGVIQPRGHLYLQNFELSPEPVFTYAAGEGIILIKKIFAVHGHNTTVVKYTLKEAPGPFSLKLYPLVTCRDFHGNTSASHPGFTHSISHLNRHARIDFHRTEGGDYSLFLTSDRAAFRRNEVWNRGFVLSREVERGEESSEDLLCPGRFTVVLKPGESVCVIASAEEGADAVPIARLEKENEKRIAGVAAGFGDGVPGDLAYAADSFIVSRRSTGKKTVIAGYHWFSDWGRDTMISLCGLTLVPGRFEVCREILATFSENIRRGIVPNRFSDDSAEPPEYNTADASLWYFYALYKYHQYTSDAYFIENSMGAMKAVLDGYIEGTDYGIKMDASDSLITQGGPGVQLTWMDAKVGELVVTPRAGKAVEINALWYNALCVYAHFARLLGVTIEDKYEAIRRRVREVFAYKFENPSGEGLYDVVDCRGIGGDRKAGISAQVRPNQIFAVSLPFSPVGRPLGRKIVDTVERHLLTDRGLRSLAPGDPEYRPRYEGGRFERDCAYHQGTVWAYLIGPFISARLRVNGYDDETLDFCAGIVDNFRAHFKEAGLMSVSEIFDASEPRRPAGCVSQAWSVAEIIRAVREDIEGRRRLSPLEEN